MRRILKVSCFMYCSIFKLPEGTAFFRRKCSFCRRCFADLAEFYPQEDGNGPFLAVINNGHNALSKDMDLTALTTKHLWNVCVLVGKGLLFGKVLRNIFRPIL